MLGPENHTPLYELMSYPSPPDIPTSLSIP
jgi:hypothetical protein